MIEFACQYEKPVRIGVNWGTLDQDLLTRMMDENNSRAEPLSAQEIMREAVVASALESAHRAVELGLPRERIILSAKVSRRAGPHRYLPRLAERCDWPLHLGLTEAGMGSKGIVASTAGMSVLLQEGIGDTIRVSLTPEPGGDRTNEVIVAQEILQTMGLRSFIPMVVACPGCGRTTSTYFQELAQSIQSHIRHRMPEWRKSYDRRGRHDGCGHGLRGQWSGREQARQHRHLAAGHGRAARGAGVHRRREGPDAQGRAHRRGIPGAGRAVRRAHVTHARTPPRQTRGGDGMSQQHRRHPDQQEMRALPRRRERADAGRSRQKCSACCGSGDGWQLVEDGKALKREFKFADFYRTMSFVNAVAHVANVEDHHPDIECGWGIAASATRRTRSAACTKTISSAPRRSTRCRADRTTPDPASTSHDDCRNGTAKRQLTVRFHEDDHVR